MKKIIITLGVLVGIVFLIGIAKFYIFPNSDTDVICTDDAKQCPDGSYVGRVGPKCEFAKCPGKPLKPDFVPTEDNPIQLPENSISEKECVAQDGEVWNTLGHTDYDGEIIGRVDGFNCPCVCLVKTGKN